MNKIYMCLKPFRRQIILGPIFKLFEALFELLLPIFMAKLIDNGIKLNNTVYIMHMGLIMISIAIIGTGCSYICQYFASLAAQGFGTSLRNSLFKHILNFSYKDIDSIGTSTLTIRITNDISAIQLGLNMAIRLLLRVPFIAICSIVMILYIDYSLVHVILFSVPCCALILFIIMARSLPMYRTVQKKLDSLSRIIRENLKGVRVIRAFGKKEYEFKRFKKENDEYKGLALKVSFFVGLSNPLTSLVLNISILGVLYFGSFNINSGTLSQGDLIACVSYFTQIVLALVMFTSLTPIYSRSLASLSRVSDIFNLNPSIVSGKEEVKSELFDKGENILSFNDVSFSYNNSEYALKNISFSLKKGETLGIIGGTGSGKSTLINLIPRFYDVENGSILVKGLDVKKWKEKTLRNIIGVVPQRSKLFTGTLYENIVFGRNDISLDDVEKAIEISQSSEFIDKLKDRLNTKLEHNGDNFSGGQKQRISIARAVVNAPEILILDDSSSALDYETDRNLRDAIKKLNSTNIIVSQRVNSVRNCDKILVLKNGKIEGLGSHKELLKSSEEYIKIAESQGEMDYE